MRLAALATLALLAAGRAEAQPDPSFRASCGDLRAKLATIEGDPSLAAIQVVGSLTRVTSDGVVAYLMVCAAPDPEVLCVAYATAGRQVGETIVISGVLERRGPDRVVLDPCLHVLPERAE